MCELYIHDTIAALSTPYGEGGVSIVRISGKDAVKIAEQVYLSPSGRRIRFSHCHAAFGYAVDPKSGTKIDEAIFLPMLAPKSYTREDVVEIQCHGGMVVVSKILDLIFSLGVRQAAPGEFTKRAFLNGRIDLLQAEAVMDVIKAKSSEILSSAMDKLAGKYSSELAVFKEKILSLIASLEAPLDYPDEDLFSFDTETTISSLSSLAEEAENMLKSASDGKILEDGLKVSLIGKPNVGKSSLLNMLLGENRAIVTEIAGTTRDVIEESCLIDGLPVRLCDTAGIHDTDGKIEKLGIEKTKRAVDESDFLMVVLDSSAPFSKEDETVMDIVLNSGKNFMVALNKNDLPEKISSAFLASKYSCETFSISAKSSYGKQELRTALGLRLKTVFKINFSSCFWASSRHREALSSISADLRSALETVKQGYSPDMPVVFLRGALNALEGLTGENYDEEILDRVFSNFCVGK